jgi:hypothetical protein
LSGNGDSSATHLVHEPDADGHWPGYHQSDNVEFQLIPDLIDLNSVVHLHGALFDADRHVSK